MVVRHGIRVGFWKAMPTPLIGPRDALARHPHLAAGRGQQAGDQLHDGRLAAARRPDHGDELALVDAEGGIGQEPSVVSLPSR